MKIIVLNNIKCEYYNPESFTISWQTENSINIQKIIIAEVESENNISVRSETFVEHSPDNGNHVIYRLHYERSIHYFIVLGISEINNNEKITPEFINQNTGYFERRKITCMGFSGVGNVQWKKSENPDDNTVNISVCSSFDIPKGFLCYSYKYRNIEFVFRIGRKIPRSSEMKHCITFYLPQGASGINMTMPGTPIKVVEEPVKKSWFDRLIEKIKK